MKILLDLQGAQTESRFRGIGRYSMSFAQAFLRAAGAHRVALLLNGMLPGVDELRVAFEDAIGADAIVTFETAGPTAERDPANAARARASECMREALIADFAPDVVHVSSPFEGWVDDAVCSIGAFDTPPFSAATLYDLIPLANPGEYLRDPRYRDYYFRKLGSLQQGDLLLAISDHSRHEAMAALGVPASRVVAIGAGVDPQFTPDEEVPGVREALHRRLGIAGAYLLYVGGFDPRKNLRRMLAAYAALPSSLRAGRQLLIVGRVPEGEEEPLRDAAKRLGISRPELVFAGHVSERELITLYRSTELFVFPSLHEGFGLPPLEAMACGAPVVGSATSSIPEVIGRGDALFDPTDVDSIAAKLAEALGNPAFRATLRDHGLVQARRFTWEACAQKALDALVARVVRRGDRPAAALTEGPRTRLAVVIDAPMGEQRDFDIVLNLARRHHIEVVTTQRSVPLHPWLLVNFPPRDVAWLDTNAPRLEALLYLAEVGRVSRVLRELVMRHPGTVALREAPTPMPDALRSTAEVAERAYRAHGYGGLADVTRGGQGDDASVQDAFDLLEGALGLVLLSRALFDRVGEAVGEAAPPLLASATGSAPEVAASISDAMRRFGTRGPRSRELRLIDAIADCGAGSIPLTDADLERCATAIAAHRPRLGPPRLLVDVSVLAHRDARTGIQRVVRGILAALLLRSPAAYRVEPIREDGNGRYVHARPLALRMLGLPSEWLQEEPVEACPGDVFLGLDLIADRLPRVESLLAQWRVRGVAIHFIVYDLLPVKLPGMFIPELRPIFSAWYAAVSRVANGIVCISRAVADEFLEWIARNPPERSTPLAVGHFPLGASFDDSHPTAGLPADAEQALAALRARPAFLMVGTIEPRKAHPQAVAAFEQLWQRGIDANLVIVGQEGWMMTAFAQRLRAHPESGRRLFWFEEASDEMLERVYETSTVLLSASLGEGFGLPLVEAAHRGLPLIARDLPVFREVAGDRAYYFSGDDPRDLARAIEDWLELHRAGRAPDSAGVDAITWAESASRLIEGVLGGAWYAHWHPGNVTTFSPQPALAPSQPEAAAAGLLAPSA